MIRMSGRLLRHKRYLPTDRLVIHLNLFYLYVLYFLYGSLNDFKGIIEA